MRCRDCAHLKCYLPGYQVYFCSLTGDIENPDSEACTEFEDRNAKEESDDSNS